MRRVGGSCQSIRSTSQPPLPFHTITLLLWEGQRGSSRLIRHINPSPGEEATPFDRESR